MLKLVRRLFSRNEIGVVPEYLSWRKMIIDLSPEQIGIPKESHIRVFGVLMDVGLVDEQGAAVKLNRVISLTAFYSGESSLQTSFGGGVIALGEIKEISEQAVKIVAEAQEHLPLTVVSDETALPSPGMIFFYLLTTSGIRVYTSNLLEIEDRENPFNKIFERFSAIKILADAMMDA